jgi:hypothetical protein
MYNKFLVSFCFIIMFFVLGVASNTVSAATLNINPATINTQNNQTFDVTIRVNAQGANINAVDAIINFDNTKLQVLQVTPGTIFGSYPLNTFQNNQIRISGIDSTFNSPFTGTDGILATIRFRAIANGQSTINFVYTPGSTTDSNVVEQGTATDRLSAVNFATVSIGDSAQTTNRVLPKTDFNDTMGKIVMAFGVITLFSGSYMLYYLQKFKKL